MTALHRLKKSELVRLWRVAGLWEGPDDCDMDDEAQEGDLKKEELVNGIIAAVRFAHQMRGCPWLTRSYSDRSCPPMVRL